jgi:antitoxin component YwqK of YwqJK toxin-antitoxin module
MVGMVARPYAALSCPLLGLLGGCAVDTRRRRDWGNACWAASALVLSVAIFSACSRKELREEKYPNGALKSRGYVKQDAEKNYVLAGLWTYWYPNGQKEAEGEYRDAKESGARGDTGILKDGRQGSWIFWYENGQKKEERTFKADKLEGPSTLWYENGRKK